MFHKNIGQWSPWFGRIPRAAKQLGHAPWLLNLPACRNHRGLCARSPCPAGEAAAPRSPCAAHRHCRKACRQPRRPSTWHSVTILVTAVPLYTIPFLKLCAQGQDPGHLSLVPALSSGIRGLGLHSQSNELAEKLLFQTHFYVPTPPPCKENTKDLYLNIKHVSIISGPKYSLINLLGTLATFTSPGDRERGQVCFTTPLVFTGRN